LLWSPIVDAWFVPRWGRRKSWIVPVQAVVGMGLWWIGGRVEGWLNAEEVDIRFITMVFGGLILAAATQGEPQQAFESGSADLLRYRC
jgi:PAT family acetyl-CoA transporter-like MFS transporter 1